MKFKGSTSDFLSHRNEFINMTFRRIYMSLPADTSVEEAYRLTAEAPSPRFWVSDTRAAIVISEMERADARDEAGRKRRLCGAPEIDSTNPKREAMMRNVVMGSGKVLQKMYPERREMYREIYRRYKELRQRYPAKSTLQLMAEIVYYPAPKPYLTPYGVRKIVHDFRKKA